MSMGLNILGKSSCKMLKVFLQHERLLARLHLKNYFQEISLHNIILKAINRGIALHETARINCEICLRVIIICALK